MAAITCCYKFQYLVHTFYKTDTYFEKKKDLILNEQYNSPLYAAIV